jgi:hypothetical protein
MDVFRLDASTALSEVSPCDDKCPRRNNQRESNNDIAMGVVFKTGVITKNKLKTQGVSTSIFGTAKLIHLIVPESAATGITTTASADRPPSFTHWLQTNALQPSFRTNSKTKTSPHHFNVVTLGEAVTSTNRSAWNWPWRRSESLQKKFSNNFKIEDYHQLRNAHQCRNMLRNAEMKPIANMARKGQFPIAAGLDPEGVASTSLPEMPRKICLRLPGGR